MATTLKKVNEALKKEFGEGIELVRGDGYYYFVGSLTNHWYEQGLYGGWLLKNHTPQDYIRAAHLKAMKNKLEETS